MSVRDFVRIRIWAGHHSQNKANSNAPMIVGNTTPKAAVQIVGGLMWFSCLNSHVSFPSSFVTNSSSCIKSKCTDHRIIVSVLDAMSVESYMLVIIAHEHDTSCRSTYLSLDAHSE